jgi:small GTP-binding protein
MGIKKILKKIFTKDKKVVICGLDNAGKTTMVSFLKTGTFQEHTPTMGKEQSTMEVQDIRMNIIDLGGQRDFRSLWLGEIQDAECVIFMLDAHASERFDEAKEELWKFVDQLEGTPLIIFANKYDLDPVASIEEIMNSLELNKLDSFEVIPVSCKTGFGIVNGFMKIYYKLTGEQLSKRFYPKALTVFDRGGTPLTSTSSEDVLKGGLFSAICSFVQESFKKELNQLKIEDNIIIFKRSPHLLGSIVLDDSESVNIREAEEGLEELLYHLEHMCPELDKEDLNTEKIEYLVKQYSSNLMN